GPASGSRAHTATPKPHASTIHDGASCTCGISRAPEPPSVSTLLTDSNDRNVSNVLMEGWGEGVWARPGLARLPGVAGLTGVGGWLGQSTESAISRPRLRADSTA